MAEEGRALMTEREREIVAGEADVTTNYQYKVQSLVRNRVRKQLQKDIDVLESDFKEVHEMVVAIVCEGRDIPDGGERASTDTAAAGHALDNLEHALERGDRELVEEALQRARDALGENDD